MRQIEKTIQYLIGSGMVSWQQLSPIILLAILLPIFLNCDMFVRLLILFFFTFAIFT
jgi:hypothetical protein